MSLSKFNKFSCAYFNCWVLRNSQPHKLNRIAQLVRNNVHVRLFMYTTERDFVASLHLSENIKRIRYRYSRYIRAMYSACWIYLLTCDQKCLGKFCQEAMHSKIQDGHLLSFKYFSLRILDTILTSHKKSNIATI